MKFKDLIVFSFRNTCRKKISFLIFLFIMTAFVSCLFSFSFKKEYETYQLDYYYKSADARFLRVGYDYYKEEPIKNRDETLTKEERIELAERGRNKAIEVILKNKHVIGVGKGRDPYAFINQIDDKNTMLQIYGVPQKNNIPIVLGENIDAYDEDEFVMICPLNVILKDENQNINLNKSVNIEHLLNQTVDVNLMGAIPMKGKIVGFYDTYKNYTDGQTCYASYKNVEKMDAMLRDDGFKETVNYTGDQIMIMIDDNRNHNEVINYLEENHFNPSFPFLLVLGGEFSVIKYCNKLTLAMTLLAGLTVGCVFFQNYVQNKEQYFLYHALGYSRIQIIKMIFVENSILIFLGFIPAIGVTQILLRLYKYFILASDNRLYYMNPIVDLPSSLIALGVGLLIPIFLTIILFIFTAKKSYEEVGE